MLKNLLGIRGLVLLLRDNFKMKIQALAFKIRAPTVKARTQTS
jgi:hypothetical protein